MGKVSDQTLYPRLTSLQDGTALYAVLDAAGNPSSRTIDLSVLRSNLGLSAYCTPPVDTEFSWVNQGAATLVTTFGNAIIVPASGSQNVRARVKATPTPPYTITSRFLFAGVSTCSVGMCLRNAGAGTLVTFYQYNGGTGHARLIVDKLNSPTSTNSTYAGADQNWAIGGDFWLRINDTGVNRICSFSADGVNFVQFHSVGRTDFLTPDQIGFFGDNSNASYTVVSNCISWRQS